MIIHSSDPRGYPALRRAFDVKHHHHSGDSIVSGNGSGSSDSEVSPIVIQQPTVDRGEERERERGRPRSKESQKSIMMLEAISQSTNTNTNINIASPEDIKSINQVGVTVVDESGKRKGSRDRKTKTGFWSLFASVDSNVVPHRSYSVPPSRELV